MNIVPACSGHFLHEHDFSLAQRKEDETRLKLDVFGERERPTQIELDVIELTPGRKGLKFKEEKFLYQNFLSILQTEFLLVLWMPINDALQAIIWFIYFFKWSNTGHDQNIAKMESWMDVMYDTKTISVEISGEIKHLFFTRDRDCQIVSPQKNSKHSEMYALITDGFISHSYNALSRTLIYRFF